jgi:hypothetical protein
MLNNWIWNVNSYLDKFAALILTHGRPDRVFTYKSLRRHGYRGAIYIIVDNEDETVDEYRKIFGDDKVIVFDKKAIAETFDTADTQDDRRAIVYARNASFPIAEQLGLDYFIQLDDDYKTFDYRFISGGKLRGKGIKSLDLVFEAMIDFLENSGAATFAMSQGGDHIGGMNGSNYYKGLMRKAMNSFVLRTDRPVQFIGRINEDVNTYVLQGSRGDLFFTVTYLQLTQTPTQSNEGGMTNLYVDSGTYVKSFYTVMMHPSSVMIGTMGNIHRRYHHMISWNNTVPKIISGKHKKQIQ